MADRIPLGQNTPLSLIGVFTAESGNDLTRDGVVNVIGSPEYVGGGDQHLRDGEGGNYALQMSTSELVATAFGDVVAREIVLAMPLWGEQYTKISLIRGGADYQCGMQILQNNAPQLFRGNAATVLALGTTGYIPAGQWSWTNLHVFTDNGTGFINLRVHAWVNLYLSYTGDTQGSATLNNMDGIEVFVTNVSTNVRIDDIFVFARTLYYSGGAGSIPTSGQTITDATAGGTAVVDFVEGTNVEGVIVVHTVSGTMETGNTIGNGAGWTATLNNDMANDKASLWVPESFSIPTETASDVLTGWTGSTGANHYSQVQSWDNTATYVYTDTAGQVDQYGMTVPSVPPNSEIVGLIVSIWGESNASPDVSQIQLGYYDGVGSEDGPDQVLPSNYGRVDTYWSYNSRTGQSFSLSQIASLNFRQTSVA